MATASSYSYNPTKKVVIDQRVQSVRVYITDQPPAQTINYVPGVEVHLDQHGKLSGLVLYGADLQISVINRPDPGAMYMGTDDSVQYRAGVLGGWKP